MTENRRVRMTKKLIQNALIELLCENPAKRVTVTEICERADVNRSTFYANYTDTEELLREIEDGVIEHMPLPKEAAETILDQNFLRTLEALFEYVRQNERLFRVLIVNGDENHFHKRIVDILTERCNEKIWLSASGVLTYGYIYCTSGVISIVRHWIESGFDINTKDFANIVFTLLSQTAEFKSINI